MPPLPTDLRNLLSRAIVEARDVAEAGARDALAALAVDRHEPHASMTPAQRDLRNRLRAHGRQLGDILDKQKGAQTVHRLLREVAYEHWHRMLFARFLAENHLLIHPEHQVPVSLDDVDELAREANIDRWELASRYAQRMLPQIFRTDDPALAVTLPPETRQRLQKRLADLPLPVFTADDSLGWTYQFWQSAEKVAVNNRVKSGEKITGETLPAVTQLFTEHYMVEFLLHNTIGGWWAAKVEAASSRFSSCASEEECRAACALPGVEWTYLRFVRREAAANADSQSASIGFFRKGDSVGSLAGNLPHWRQDAVTYFVTFRTDDSLPQEKLQQWRQERDAWLADHPEPHDDQTRAEYFERFPERIERWLDQGYGACALRDESNRAIVEGALRHFDGDRCHLDEFVVAGNHVHAIVTPRPGHTLSDILHSWKSFTANAINKRLGANGAFWQKESFDHILRSPQQLERIRGYIRDHRQGGSGFQPLQGQTRQDAASTLVASTFAPAAGTYDAWPRDAKSLRILDPCCGSGHFLVAAFDILVRLRIAEEHLSTEAAIRAVLEGNLFGLELDPRCTQIAAFNLAFAAWKLAGKPIDLPPLNIACSGVGPHATQEEWLKMAEKALAKERPDVRLAMQRGLIHMHELFSDAPELGSLIDPSELPAEGFAADFETIKPLLDRILAAESADDEAHERAVAARGMAAAAEILAGDYTLVITNVPFLGRLDQSDQMRSFFAEKFSRAKADLATVLYDRSFAWLAEGGTTVSVVPQNAMFLSSFAKARENWLQRRQLDFAVRLGEHAFESTAAAGGFAALLGFTRAKAPEAHQFVALDASAPRGSDPIPTAAKPGILRDGPTPIVSQKQQLANPSCSFIFEANTDNLPLLQEFAYCHQGSGLADISQFRTVFWEHADLGLTWSIHQSSPTASDICTGMHFAVRWEQGRGELVERSPMSGKKAWGNTGVAIAWLGKLPASLYLGTIYDNSASVILPHEEKHLLAIWTYCFSPQFNTDVRKINQKTQVANATMVQVPFDLDHWQKVAAEKYPNGLPEPQSDDPTQWLFHGRPERAEAHTALQVGVARLVGYRWPAELDEAMRLAPEARDLVNRCAELADHADNDGIVCLTPLRGEASAADRLRRLLAAAFGSEPGGWSNAKEQALLAAAAEFHKDKKPAASLDEWLRERFFEEHCKVFGHRPFVWHIWDGRPDGFNALVNYHRLCGSGFQPLQDQTRQDAAPTLGRKTLESLTYTYLGDWIERQKAEQRAPGEGAVGADARLAAAMGLQQQLEKILAGEPPCDIFVRWKPLREQPIGWEPDINDGVRLNIRPFLSATLRKGGKKGAGVLRWKPNIRWAKDRGQEPRKLRPREDFPWFWGWDEDKPEHAEDFGSGLKDTAPAGREFDGNRWNDLHYTRAAKEAARERAMQGEAATAGKDAG